MASVVVGSIQVCFTAVAALTIDKTGRKVLLYISGKTVTEFCSVRKITIYSNKKCLYCWGN